MARTRARSALRRSLPVVIGLAAFSGSARAETTIAADADVAFPKDSSAERGKGFGARVGRRLSLPLLVGGPEIGGSWVGFPGDASLSVIRGTAGLRLGVGEIVRPGVFGHVGLGKVSVDVPGASGGTSFGWDAGAFVDFTLVPLVNVGVHGTYAKQAAAGDVSDLTWYAAGAHVELVL